MFKFIKCMLFLIICALIGMTVSCKKIPKEPARVYTDVNIPDGEYLRYENYFNKEKYADMYVVTRKITNEKYGYVYKSYVDLINVADNRKPDKDYTKWPSYTITEPKLGRTLESLGSFNTNVFNNWYGWEGIFYWYVKMDPDKVKGEYIYKMTKHNKTNDFKGAIRNYKPNVPLCDFWGTFFIQSRFVDYHSESYLATVNPPFMDVPMNIIYRPETNLSFKTPAGVFNAFRYNTDFFECIRMTPENFPMIFRFIPEGMKRVKDEAKDPFAFYVDNSDKRYMLEIANTGGGGGDYLLAEISNVISFKK